MISITQFFLLQGAIILTAVIIFVIRNVFIQNRKLSKMVQAQDKYIMELYQTIKMSEVKIKEIDQKQIFQGDDEIGWFFTSLKKMQEVLSEYVDLYSKLK